MNPIDASFPFNSYKAQRPGQYIETLATSYPFFDEIADFQSTYINSFSTKEIKPTEAKNKDQKRKIDQIFNAAESIHKKVKSSGGIPLDLFAHRTFQFSNGILECRYATPTEGTGIYHYNNKNELHFKFKDGIKQGPAAFKFSNGDLKEFNYENGYKHGPVAYRFANGDTLYYTYERDIRTGNGFYQHSNHNFLEFTYQNNVRVGKATYKIGKYTLHMKFVKGSPLGKANLMVNDALKIKGNITHFLFGKVRFVTNDHQELVIPTR